MSWSDWARAELGRVDALGRRRTLRTFDAFGPVGDLDGRRVVSFASNDYLGLSAHPAVIDAAQTAAARWGTGATASRLVIGTRPCHATLEERYAEVVGAERAVVCSSGYAANLAAITAVTDRDTTVVSDELNHASIIDGCRLSRARTEIYRHGDVDHLAALVSAAPGRCVVVTDTVFSMDGDVAPVAAIAELCAHHGALLVVDEAHAVLGPVIPDLGAEVLRVGTLSKALGSLGGVVAGPAPLVELIVNRARSFIFSTALTPADTAAADAALAISASADGDARRRRLRDHIDALVPGHPTPIVPVVLGDEQVAVDAAQRLLESGVLVPAIRPPTVAPGTSRLRIALSAAHDAEMVALLRKALAAAGIVP